MKVKKIVISLLCWRVNFPHFLEIRKVVATLQDNVNSVIIYSLSVIKKNLLFSDFFLYIKKTASHSIPFHSLQWELFWFNRIHMGWYFHFKILYSECLINLLSLILVILKYCWSFLFIKFLISYWRQDLVFWDKVK